MLECAFLEREQVRDCSCIVLYNSILTEKYTDGVTDIFSAKTIARVFKVWRSGTLAVAISWVVASSTRSLSGEVQEFCARNARHLQHVSNKMVVILVKKAGRLLD